MPPGYAAAANMLLLTLPGTPICYYGDEIGMQDAPMTPANTKDIKALIDPVNILALSAQKGIGLAKSIDDT